MEAAHMDMIWCNAQAAFHNMHTLTHLHLASNTLTLCVTQIIYWCCTIILRVARLWLIGPYDHLSFGKDLQEEVDQNLLINNSFRMKRKNTAFLTAYSWKGFFMILSPMTIRTSKVNSIKDVKGTEICLSCTYGGLLEIVMIRFFPGCPRRSRAGLFSSLTCCSAAQHAACTAQLRAPLGLFVMCHGRNPST